MTHVILSKTEQERRKVWITAEQAALNARIAALPPLEVTLRELAAMAEYSCSVPTGTTLGKRWKNEQGSYIPGFVSNGGKPKWMIGEYTSYTEDKKEVNITWYRPVIRVKARSEKVNV